MILPSYPRQQRSPDGAAASPASRSDAAAATWDRDRDSEAADGVAPAGEAERGVYEAALHFSSDLRHSNYTAFVWCQDRLQLHPMGLRPMPRATLNPRTVRLFQ